ncbi:RNA polymerase sigma-70 factor [Psychrobacillus sp. NPDC058041]|uniref:RNA polymerase sigma-70 factor n=1 Tax=Psychrobacillus sp. NPDC058041 TaxID=3346310 RepID=UPI0036D87EC3
MDTENLYYELKPLLFSLSYHILGSLTDAEDMVHEAFLSLQKIPEEKVSHVRSYMCKIVTHRSIDLLRSAHKQREIYVGPWLPEPVMTENGTCVLSDNPLDSYMLKESLSTAYMLLLHQLSATERVVFLLREVYQYRYNEIAEIVDKSSTNCRQIYSRAKKSIGDLPKNDSSKVEKEFLSEKFAKALMTGNMNQLFEVLTSEATLYTDGGGKVQAAIRPIYGMDKIVRYFQAIFPKVPKGFTCSVHEINSQPGVIIKIVGTTFTIVTFHFHNDRISDVYIVMNPEKLTHFNDGDERNIW